MECREIKLARACVHELVAFLGSQLKANLHMEQACVDGCLMFGQGANIDAVVLPQAKVGGGLIILDTTIHGPLNMESIEVGKSLELYEGNQFGAVNLRAAKIQEALAIIGSTFWGSLDMEAIQVQGSVFYGGRNPIYPSEPSKSLRIRRTLYRTLPNPKFL